MYVSAAANPQRSLFSGARRTDLQFSAARQRIALGYLRVNPSHKRLPDAVAQSADA